MKKTRFAKAVLLMLCLVMLGSMFAACDDGNQLQQSTTTRQDGPTGPLASTIPEELDYDGHQAKMLIYSSNVKNSFPIN